MSVASSAALILGMEMRSERSESTVRVDRGLDLGGQVVAAPTGED